MLGCTCCQGELFPGRHDPLMADGDIARDKQRERTNRRTTQRETIRVVWPG